MKVETDAVLVGCCAGCNHSHEAPEWQSVRNVATTPGKALPRVCQQHDGLFA